MASEPSGGKLKLALVMSGGVSLGSYEAGVVYELLKAMEDQAITGGSGLSIDVVVGASAGSINGALLAYILSTGAEKSLLHDIWVKSFDFRRFKKGGQASLIDGSEINRLLTEVMTGQEGQTGRYGPQEEVLLNIPVTNLEGLKFLITPSKGGKVIETYSFADKLKFTFRPGLNAASTWANVIKAVQASSAFPAVFAPVQINRDPGDYPSWFSPPTKVPLKFTYIDGGVMDNRPLGLAIESTLTKKLLPGEIRLFLLVEPSHPEKNIQPKDHYSMMDTVIASLWSIPTYDSLYREITRIAKINTRKYWLEQLVDSLTPWLEKLMNQLDPKEVKQINDILMGQCLVIAEEYLRELRITNSRQARLSWEQGREKYLDGELLRIKQKIGLQRANINEYQDFSLFLIFILEHLSNLSRKEELIIERIMPANPGQELAGEFLAHFGGALDQQIREHDFRVGRLAGRNWLAEKDISYQPDPEEAYQLEPNYGQFAWGDLPLKTKIEITFFFIKTLFRFTGSLIKPF